LTFDKNFGRNAEYLKQRSDLRSERLQIDTKRNEEARLERAEREKIKAIADQCVESNTRNTTIPVRFQFTLAADKKGFAITFNDMAWNLKKLLDLIYR